MLPRGRWRNSLLPYWRRVVPIPGDEAQDLHRLGEDEKVAELRSAGVAALAIAEQLGISLATVYRLVPTKEDPSTARE